MNDSPSKNDGPNRVGCGWFFVFTIAFGVFLLATREANRAQLIFRYSMIGFGVFGLIVYSLVQAMQNNGKQ